jgi:hypothetical protein
MNNLNFFTVAVKGSGKREDFTIWVLPYITSVCITYPNATVEVVVDDLKLFKEEYKSGIKKLRSFFGGRFLLRQLPERYKARFNSHNKYIGGCNPRSLRWTLRPETNAKYTYVGDIDILMLEDNMFDYHLPIMKRTNLPYSNKSRLPVKRLGGLHFCDTKKWYERIPQKYVDSIVLRDNSQYVSEFLLFHLAEKFHKITDNQDRSMHGIHMCKRRPICGSFESNMNWALTYKRIEKFDQLRNNEMWKSTMPHFNAWYFRHYWALCGAIEWAKEMKFDIDPNANIAKECMMKWRSS